MGTWGVELFSDDTAADVRAHYRELIEDGVEDCEATRQALEHFQDYLDDEDAVQSCGLRWPSRSRNSVGSLPK